MEAIMRMNARVVGIWTAESWALESGASIYVRCDLCDDVIRRAAYERQILANVPV